MSSTSMRSTQRGNLIHRNMTNSCRSGLYNNTNQNMPVLLNCHCFSAPRTPCALAQIYICTFILYFYHMITKQLLWFWCPCLSFVGKRKEVSCSFVMWAEANIRRISNDYLQGLPFLRDSTLICLVTSLWPRADCCRLYCPVDPV